MDKEEMYRAAEAFKIPTFGFREAIHEKARMYFLLGDYKDSQERASMLVKKSGRCLDCGGKLDDPWMVRPTSKCKGCGKKWGIVEADTSK